MRVPLSAYHSAPSYFWAFGKSVPFPTRSFLSKFLGISLLDSASKEGHTWEHGPSILCKLLSSRSFSERFKGVSKKAFCVEVPWGVPFRSESKKYLGTQGTYHLKLLFKLLFRTPENILCCEPFFERRDACKPKQMMSAQGGAIANDCAIVNRLRVVIYYCRY